MTSERAPLVPSQRLLLAGVGFLGCVMVYALRVNLSVAIVCMVDQEAVAQLTSVSNQSLTQGDKANGDTCAARSSQATPVNGSALDQSDDGGEFVWTKKTQGLLLGAFFWGYPFSQIVGGTAATRFGGKYVLGGMVLASSLLTVLSPMAARMHVYVLMGLRVLLGVCQGVTFPAFHAMWSHWSPPMERSLLTGMTYAGAQIGNVITMPISGLLCRYGFAGGWPSVFYILGIVGLFWVVLWQLTVADSPSSHKRISNREKEYIESALSHQVKKEGHTHTPVPWLSVLKSLPVWAAVVGHFAGDWGAYIMFTSLPTFMNDVLKFDLTSLGFVASIPYIAYFICINVAAVLADTVRAKNLLSTLNTRRCAMIIALGSQSVFLLMSGYMACGQEILVIIFLTLGIGLSGFQYAGFIVNYLDIAPAFAGPILGIGNTLSCVAGILSPALMGYMTPDGTREQWQGVFWLTAAILLLGMTFFVLCASGDVQSWAVLDHNKNGEAKELKLLQIDAKILKPDNRSSEKTTAPLV